MLVRTLTRLASGNARQAVSTSFSTAAPAAAFENRQRTGKYEKRIKTAAAKAKASSIVATQEAAQATRQKLLDTLNAEGESYADGKIDDRAGSTRLVYGFTDEMVVTCDPEVQKIFALENAGKDEINRLRVQAAMAAMQRFEGDTGSPEVQIAGLTARIRILVEHLSEHHKDDHSRYGLNKLVQQRRKLLMYLRSTHLPKYAATLTALGLRPIKSVKGNRST